MSLATIKYFIRNLHPQLGMIVQSKNTNTVPEAYKIAQEIEAMYPNYSK